MRACTLLLLLVACKPDLGAGQSLVTTTRFLAVKGEPAEAVPGSMITYTLLVGSPDGTVMNPGVNWAFCMAPKPLTENNAVAAACEGDDPMNIALIGGPAAMIQAATPMKACSIFGPEPPDQLPGQPPLRPRDPDITGGFYQPVRVWMTGADDAFALERIKCNLPNAPIDVVQEYVKRYVVNTNPHIAGVNFPPSVAPGAKTTFQASWTPDSVETYPVFDLVTRTLVDHREAMRVSWYATAGEFVHDRTGRSETETDTTTDNDWTAPTAGGVVHFWIVLRDSRGGIDFQSFDVMVGPG
jgi:hypothetical protein